jgi:hypothetical protein
MLLQDASRMLPLCMAVYGSVHSSVRKLPCAQLNVCGSVYNSLRAGVCSCLSLPPPESSDK